MAPALALALPPWGWAVVVVAVAVVVIAAYPPLANALSPRVGGIPHLHGLPLLGQLPSFAADATRFIDGQRRRLGDTFSVHLARTRTIFITNPLDFGAVWRNKQLSFKAVGDGIMRAVSEMPAERADLANDDHIHQLWGKYLNGDGLLAQNAAMARLLTRELVDAAPTASTASTASTAGTGGEWTHGMLQDWSSRLLFRVGLELMFGAGLPADDLHQAFRDLDGSFPLIAANLPGTRMLLKRAFAGRDAIAAELVRAQARAGAPTSLGTVRHAYFLSKGYSEREAATVNVLLVWALHANTSPAAFWALALTVNDPVARAAVRAEVDDLYARLPGWLDDPKQLGAALDSCPLVTSVMWEALRMSASSFGLRDAVANTTLTLTRPPAAGPVRPGEAPSAEDNTEATAIPAGSRVFMVTAHHTDEAVFPQAARFVYNRFAPATPGGPPPVFRKDGRELRWPPVVPFGGGVSMCPGRFVAMNEIRVFLVLALRHRDYALVAADGSPQPGGGVPLPPVDSTRAGLGVLPPVRDVPFAWRPRAVP